MFSNDFLEKVFTHPEMRKIPVGAQSTAVQVFSEILEDRLEENPYEQLSSLFVPTATDK